MISQRPGRRYISTYGLWITLLVGSVPALAQEGTPTADDVATEVTKQAADDDAAPATVAEKVQVDPVNSDQRIENRLQEILKATGWFTDSEVRVDRGVAFLTGIADTEKHQQWAEATAMKTSDVVAVVNRLQVADRPFWNFAPALRSMKDLAHEATSLLPLVLVAAIVVLVGYYLARLAALMTRKLTSRSVDSQLLQQVAGNVVGVLIFIVAFYIALRVSGLTRLAVTLLGGTGLVGLAIGFAFRDIAENYLASILISLNHPFRVGDLIEVGDVGGKGAMGFVRRVTMRGTILSTLEGNQIQLPNSTVYKGMVTNYTATPLSRLDFSVGVGFEDSIGEAQDLIMQVLTQHEAVVSEPAPMVLVESLGSATVNLKVYYWFDLTKNSGLKVGSSIIRQVKQSLTAAGITMPDEARELVFPHGVPVQISETPVGGAPNPPAIPQPKPQPSEAVVNRGEGDLETERTDVMKATDGDETIAGEANLIE
ncbi:Small-conductance mechanosensitive channel [Rosistilla carotiformis]|uniref:Small-conductance mechanosensitive channel n=1 Tax=Rosistilla carotiformis TaxID=2528017 RepID=A0A518JUM2_9BACT|nr:Small-conductance mechanosensitive channel [Rosistilla carotiformis]